MGERRTTRRLIRIFASSVVAIAVVAGPARVATAEDLTWESDITYSTDLEAGRLHVHGVMKLTNVTPNTTSGNVITQYYYEGISLPMPDTATNVTATTSGGSPLEVDVHPSDEPGFEDVSLAEIGFSRNLYYKQSTTIILDYDIPGDPPRTESVFRVNAAYVSFGVFGWGDSGKVNIDVVLPRSFQTDFGGYRHTFSLDPDNVTYHFAEVENPEEFFVWVQGWDESGMFVSDAGLDEFDILVKAWPDDPGWDDEVLETVGTGLPALQNLIGLPWKPNRTLDILESQDVTLAGYAGWYLDLEKEIHIGEWVDPHVVLHELSHTWFDGELFEERWINEGLADEFAAAALVDAGLETTGYPRPDRAPFPYDASMRLNDWVVPDPMVIDDPDAYEAYGYDTSFWVVQEVANEIGHEALAKVLTAARDDEVAYRVDGVPETSDTEIDDWHRFLDLLQEVGGSENADDLFASFVTTDSLAERERARENYQPLRQTGWDIPMYVREAMEDWEFDTAQDRINQATDIIVIRDRIEHTAEELGVDPPKSLEDAFESATNSLDEVSSLAESQDEAVDMVRDAVEQTGAERDFFTSVGLIGYDPEKEMGDVIRAFEGDDMTSTATEAEEVTELFESAPGRGRLRVAVGSGTVVVTASAAVVAIVWRRRNRSHDPTEPTESGQPGPDES